MNIWTKEISAAFKEHFAKQPYHVDFDILNSQVMFNYGSYVFLVIKSYKEQKVFLNLLEFDIANIQKEKFTPQKIKSIEIQLFIDGQKENLKSKHRESRIEIRVNDNQPSYWLLTIETPSRNGPQTQVFLSKFQLVVDTLPSKISFHQINTLYNEISKVAFHPQSTDIVVILYKKPCIDFINYVNNINFPQLQLDLQLSKSALNSTEFVDIQFGRKVSQIFDIYLLSKDGYIYYLQKVLINGTKLEEGKSVEFRNHSSYQSIKRFTKIQNNIIEIVIDNEEAIERVHLKKIKRQDRQSQRDRNYFEFKYLDFMKERVFILTKQGETIKNTSFTYETLMVTKNNYDAYKLCESQLSSGLSTAFVGNVKFSNPVFLPSVSSQFIHILYLNSIIQLNISTLSNILSGTPASIQRALQTQQTIVPFKLLGITQQLSSLQLLTSQACGFYGILFIQNMLLLFRSTISGDYKLRSYYLYTELNNKQIETLKQQFLNTANKINNKQDKDKKDIPKSQSFALDTQSLNRNLSNLLQTRANHLEYIQREIKKKQLNLFSLRNSLERQTDGHIEIIKRKKDLSSRLDRITERTKNLLSDLDENKVQVQKIQIQNPKLQVFSQNIREMRNEFDIQKNTNMQGLSFLSNKIELQLKNKKDIIQSNWNAVLKLNEDLQKVIKIQGESD